MTTRKTHRQELKNSEFKTAYDALEPEYRLADALIKARIAKKMTQSEVAEKAGVSRTVVARLENGTTNPTLGTVRRVAHILGKDIRLVSAN